MTNNYFHSIKTLVAPRTSVVAIDDLTLTVKNFCGLESENDFVAIHFGGIV